MKEQQPNANKRFRKFVAPALLTFASASTLVACNPFNNEKEISTPDGKAGNVTVKTEECITVYDTKGNLLVAAGEKCPRPEPTATPTEAPRPTAVPEPANLSCPDAEMLGPWAPGKNGEPERFEVNSLEPGTITVVNAWIPNVTPRNTEYRIILNQADATGRRIEIIGAGVAWQFKKGCSMETVLEQINEHEERRRAVGITTNPTTVQGFALTFPANIKVITR